MEPWQILLVAALALAALGYCAWRVAKLFLRGWKDQLWIWRDANRAGRFLLFICCFIAIREAITEGFGADLAFTGFFGAIMVCVPYIAYASGRLAGMWGGARRGGRLS